MRRGRSSAGSVRGPEQDYREPAHFDSREDERRGRAAPQSLTNVRLFVQEDGEPKCRCKGELLGAWAMT